MARLNVAWHTSRMAERAQQILNYKRENNPHAVGPLYDDQRRAFGLTKVGWLNLILLQWFGWRLFADCDRTDRGHLIVGWSVCRAWPLAAWRLDYQIVSVAWAVLVLLAVAVL